MIRTRYHEKRSAPLPPVDPSRLPQLGAEPDEDAAAEWLGHIAAGRITVR